MKMELRHIRYFLTVAEEGHFTRAAARLGIGQPPLSMQIKDLEAEIGEQLFYRMPHGAELTAAGQAFMEKVKAFPLLAADAIHAARRAAKGEMGQLRLGFTATAPLNPAIPALIRAFRRGYPEVELTLTEANSSMLAAALAEERLDVAILRPSEPESEEVAIAPLVKERLVAVLPAAHHAAKGKGTLDIASLKNDAFILTPRNIGPNLHNAAFDACKRGGFEPMLGQVAPQVVSILSLVSAELGVSLVPDSMCQLNVPGVVFRSLGRASPGLHLAIAYRKRRAPVLAANFVRLALRKG